MTSKEQYEQWVKKVTEPEVKKQLEAMKGDDKAIENAFYKYLEFGTAGLRGELGAGTNCLNVYTIRKVTQGIADCMKQSGLKTAAISYDSRINSDVFAAETAKVFAANGIKAYLTKELMPTPYLSFIVRHFKADIGVMITASHNPAKYNGYKVYGSDGCQLTDARANEMIGYIDNVDPFKVTTAAIDSYVKSGKIEYVGDDIAEYYLSEVMHRAVGNAEGLKIAYSPLNGTGYKLVPEILRRMKAETLDIVKEQGYPDGRFETCSYPNPEKPEALKLGLQLAREKEADILIATDPDADRMGIAVRHNGDYTLMTGNEVGVLLTDYVFSKKKENGTLPENPVLVKTIVSTALAAEVAREYDADVRDVLTGFKYIGDVIGKLEAKGEADRFVLGFEESYGYLSGSYVRDKDAVVASMLTASMTAHYKKQGKTLVDRITEIYEKYGYYEHKLKSYEYAGAEGNAKMKKILSDLRNNLPEKIGGMKVTDTVDYMTQTRFDLPKSNVLSFKLDNGCSLIVRPSGTEPLIKVYFTAAKTREENAALFAEMNAYADSVLKA
jgi:phosphoglucomutase